MISEENGRFVVRVGGKCYGKYRLMEPALRKQTQVELAHEQSRRARQNQLARLEVKKKRDEQRRREKADAHAR